MLPSRYNISNLKRVFNNPYLLKREIERLTISSQKRVINSYFKYKEDYDVMDVMKQDWDNLIILDACRFDYFKKRNTIGGKLNKRVSAGGDSWEFMTHNFVGRELHDTVYVTANAHVDRIPDNIFYRIENTLDRWNSEIEVVHPEDVTSAAIEAYHTYPNKRLIIHYMQPHTPWLGSTANKIRKEYEVRGNDPNHGKRKLDSGVSDPRTGNTGWFGLVQKGDISQETMRQAYSETLDIVLDQTEVLLKRISGKSVITADHGEMLGERIFYNDLYGHHNNLWTKQLRYVPWLEIESDERRDVVEDEPLERERMEENVVEKRLRALGYR